MLEAPIRLDEPISRRSCGRPFWALIVLMVMAATSSRAAAGPFFIDRAVEWGLDFVHFNGMSGEYYFPEMTGQGVGLLDYDGDGDLDAYLVQGAMLGPGKTLAEALFPPRDPPPRDRLFRNDLSVSAEGRPVPRFVDVTERAGLRALGYGMGVASGDFDKDGHIDVYVTNYGPNQLWRSQGDGTFRDVTSIAGVESPEWSTSASFVDYDRDGWLDLYVVNYVFFDLVRNPRCYTASSRRDYCGPSDFEPQPDYLFRNRGDGTFEEVSGRALLSYQPGPGLGVVATDLDLDGRIDLYVANDGALNQLWINQGDGTLRDNALLAGVAINREGRAEASMGVDVGDFDRDGDGDIFVTHLMGETNTLYVNDGSGLFEDRTIENRLGAGSIPYTSFGTAWLDFDNDGWLDLIALNGAVRVLEPVAAQGDPYPLSQPNQLFRNLEGRRFEEVTEAAGEAFAVAEVSRGAALGDVDQDGDIDILVANNNGRARLLVNDASAGKDWLGFWVKDGITGGDLLGAQVTVSRAGVSPLVRRVRRDGSYGSTSDPRVLVGLDHSRTIEEVRVLTPTGDRWTLRQPPADVYLHLSPRRKEPGGRER